MEWVAFFAHFFIALTLAAGADQVDNIFAVNLGPENGALIVERAHIGLNTGYPSFCFCAGDMALY